MAFQSGDPAKAWALCGELVQLARECCLEAAKARFLQNFGTPRCNHCEGLKAGPGVVATCFQVRQCYYTNFREGESTLKQLRVLQTFLGDEG